DNGRVELDHKKPVHTARREGEARSPWRAPTSEPIPAGPGEDPSDGGDGRRGVKGGVQSSTTRSPFVSTATWIERRPCCAGGLTTAPERGSNSEPWHGHTMRLAAEE